MLKRITAEQYDEIRRSFSSKVQFIVSDYDFTNHYYALAPDEMILDNSWTSIYREDITNELTNIAHCNAMIAKCNDDTDDDYEDYEADSFKKMKHNAQSRKSTASKKLAKEHHIMDKEIVYAWKYASIKEI